MILFGNQQNRSTLVAYGNGLLYNWYAVNGDSGSGTKVFAPSGWHVPTQTELNTLATYLGGASVAGGKLKSIRTELQPGWNSPNTGADDSSGFRGFGAGRRSITGSFALQSTYKYIWLNSESGGNGIYYILRHDVATIVNSFGGKTFGASIRLLKDDSNWYPGMIVTDLDGNKYPTVKIGNQVWLKSNWKCTKYNDGTAIPNVTNETTWAGLTTGAYCSYLNQPIVEYFEKFPL